MSPSTASYPLVFVYGTLKRGYHNHHLMQQIGAEFVCAGRTIERFPLVVHGLPYLLDLPETGHQVEGEIYRVSREGFVALDHLEGHPDWYRRRLIPVVAEDGDTYESWAYFLLERADDLADLPAVARYR